MFQTSGDKLVKAAASLAAQVIVWLMQNDTGMYLYGNTRHTLIITVPTSLPCRCLFSEFVHFCINVFENWYYSEEYIFKCVKHNDKQIPS